jgi:magnesium transporter
VVRPGDRVTLRGTYLLTIYRDSSGLLETSHSLELPESVIWIDLLNATDEEKAFVESRVGVRIPSMESLNEIESSSRLAVREGIVYLSTPVVAQGDTTDPFLSPVGFILSAKLLITVRFAELSIFKAVADRVASDGVLHNSMGVFTALMEALVDRGADVLERLGSELDQISRAVFRGDPNKVRHSVRSNEALRQTLSAVGRIGDRLSQARDVFLGVGRIAPFVLGLPYDWIVPAFAGRLSAVAKDIASLNDYEAHLSTKVQFLLDAVLGFITIEQNDLFKVLTIVSVVGIPPTLMAGIYGMNFRFMPELSWPWGYPFGLGIIALSALIPLIWFKWRGWF